VWDYRLVRVLQTAIIPTPHNFARPVAQVNQAVCVLIGQSIHRSVKCGIPVVRVFVVNGNDDGRLLLPFLKGCVQTAEFGRRLIRAQVLGPVDV
jgi:ribosomal protein S28E/S33